MKDSRIGSYGAVALTLALVLKVGVVSALAASAAALASRAALVLQVWWLPYAGDAAHAKAKPLAMQTDGRSVAAATAWLLLLAGGLATALCARWLRRRLGGFTGDTLGASQQIVDLAGLLAWAAVLGPGARQ